MPGAMPCARNASRISRVRSCLYGVCMMPKSVVFVSHMANPEWCLVVRTTYLMPASFASAAQSLGSNLRGLKVFGSSSKNRFV